MASVHLRCSSWNVLFSKNLNWWPLPAIWMIPSGSVSCQVPANWFVVKLLPDLQLVKRKVINNKAVAVVSRRIENSFMRGDLILHFGC